MKLKFRQFNDTVEFHLFTWIFNLFRKREKRVCLRSNSYGLEVTGFIEYFSELGKKDALIEILKSKKLGIKSLSLPEYIVRLSILLYGQSVVLVIFNWDTSQLGRIRERLPGIEKEHFNQDLIFIPCASRVAAQKIQKLLSTDMAYTCIVDAGVCVFCDGYHK